MNERGSIKWVGNLFIFQMQGYHQSRLSILPSRQILCLSSGQDKYTITIRLLLARHSARPFKSQNFAICRNNKHRKRKASLNKQCTPSSTTVPPYICKTDRDLWETKNIVSKLIMTANQFITEVSWQDNDVDGDGRYSKETIWSLSLIISLPKDEWKYIGGS